MNNMTPELQVAVVQLVAKVGITAATTLLEGLKAAKTIDDAIAALKAAEEKTWKDYKDEASKS